MSPSSPVSLPQMLKTFFGIETAFTRDLWAMLNTTTFAATLAATYLCFDPIRKAVFVLRCFHGASLQSGEDLRVELKALRQSARAATVVALLLLGTVARRPARAGARRSSASAAGRIRASSNDSLDRVLQRREYAWRLPREAAQVDEQKGWLATFIEGLWKKIVRTAKQVTKWIKKVWDWLRQIFERQPKERDPGETRPDRLVANRALDALRADRGRSRSSVACCSGAGTRGAASKSRRRCRPWPCRT